MISMVSKNSVKGFVRKPVVAGMFYDSDPNKLTSQLTSFFKNVKIHSKSIGVISPHAGYVYSGQTAAWATASLKQAKTFVILGPNHNTVGEQFSIMSSGEWKTPLGTTRINSDVAGKLKESCDFLEEDPAAHAIEHSIEVQLPLLQHIHDDFDIVPVSIINTEPSDDLVVLCEKLGMAIAMLVRHYSIGIIASSDFSHYVSREEADEKDREAIKKILSLDASGFFKTLESTDASICGFGTIAVLMSAAKVLGLSGKLIHKSTSGDVTGDNRSVVAYHAIGFE